LTIPNSARYAQTRQAWRDIWISTDFDRELRSLDYPHAQRMLRHYVPDLPRDAPILEAGGGPAHIVYYLRQRGYPIIGLDYALEALSATHHSLPDLPLLVGDVHALPYVTNSLGAYLSFGVVEHFEQGLRPALTEAFRALRLGGVLVLTVPHSQIVEMLYQIRQRIAPAPIQRAYDHRELADHVRSVGFADLKITPISHSYTFYGLSPMFRVTGGY